MSATSSDAESSCGWTILSNEGSDIETLGSEAVVEYAAELLERPPVEEVELQDIQASASAAEYVEASITSLDDTVGEQTIDETLYAPEAGDNKAGIQHTSLLSSSDHSDIVTLRDLKEDEHVEVEEEAAVHEELYLGTSCSSQYTFTAAETAGLMLSHWKLPHSLESFGRHLRIQLSGGPFSPVFPAQQPALTNSSSSEDEAGRSSTTVVRRRRLRKNTASVVTEPEEEQQEELESEEDEEKEDEGRQEEQAKVRPAAMPDARVQGQSSSVLNKCILLALVVAISMGFGHFYGTVQSQERQKTVEKMKESELDGVKDLLPRHVQEQLHMFQGGELVLDDLDEQKVISLLTQVIETMKKENRELSIQQARIQAQRDNLEMLLKQDAEERTNIESQQQMAAENQLLKSSLEHEEKSLSTLQEELKNLRAKIKDREAMGAGADSLLLENQKLKEQLEEEKQLIQSIQDQREDMMAEAQTLRRKLDKEKKVTDELRRELNLLRSHIHGAEKEAGSEEEELQSRLMELEKRLSFEQQRSDLWERLYVETKEARAKGDTESKVKKSKEGMAGKVKETFDAVKNSTKEFVHHHKEQIKKAKEAVKENLRKFSDSVKLTFRNFKDSASTFINKARGFYDKRRDEKNTKSWQHRFHKHHHRHSHRFDDSFQSNHNTRKSGDKVHEDQDQNTRKSSFKRCSGVFECAYQESMSLFNTAMEPIRADEFYQLLQSYLQREVDHFHHWKDLETFINNFFHNGVFIHDRMLFTDFVSGVEDYLTDMHEYHDLDEDVFGDLDDYIYRHFFGEAYTRNYGPSGPFERPDADSKESRAKHHQRKQHRAKSRPHGERKWSRSGRNADRHMADVKIELGPMPFDPKY